MTARSETTTRPDRRQHHSLRPATSFWLVAIAFAVNMVGTTLPTPLYPHYQHEFGFSTTTVTVIFATYAVGVLTALILFGSLSDQIGRRWTLLPALACSALSAVLFLTAHSLPMLLTARVFSGLSAGLFTGAATAALVDLAGPRHTDRATLVGTAVNMLGLGLGPPLAGLLATYAPLPLRLPYALHLCLLVFAAVAIWRMPEPVARTGAPRLRVARPSVPAEVRATFARAATAGFAGFSVFGIFAAVSPSFLNQVLDVHNPAMSGLVVFSVFAASTVGQVLLVPLAGRAALTVGCVGLAVGMVLLAAGLAVASLPLLVGAAVVAGLGQGMTFRSGLAAVNAQAPSDKRGAVASTFYLLLYVAISVPVVGEGLAADAFGLRSAGITFCLAVAALAAAALVVLLVGTRRAQPQSQW